MTVIPGYCQAKKPLPLLFDREWMLCGQPATRRHVYTCGAGHEREGLTCEEHQPRPGMVSCAQCFEAGTEREMTAREVAP